MFELRVKTWLDADRVKSAVKSGTTQRVAKCALMVEGEAKRILSKGRSRPGTAKLGEKNVPTLYEHGPANEPPRLRSGNLRASIKSSKTETGSYVVGPTTTAWYGRIHEFGPTKISVTPKMRGWILYNLGIRLKPSTTQIAIPSRPFMRPALLAMVNKFPEQFKDIPLGGTVS
jgi:phage gpG-like protein